MIFKYSGSKLLQQTSPELLSRPSQLEDHFVLSKINPGYAGIFRMNTLYHPDYLLRKLLSCPITKLDRSVLQGCSSIVRIDIAIGALQKETHGLASKRLLDRLPHDSDVVCGILPVVTSQNHGMTCVVHQNR